MVARVLDAEAGVTNSRAVAAEGFAKMGVAQA
jgi:hypothetical protein